MSAVRTSKFLERRLREIEREKARIREQMEEVREWADTIPDPGTLLKTPRYRETAVPDMPGGEEPIRPFGTTIREVEVVERLTEDTPEHERALDFEPGPEGLDTKRVVMPRLQRTDLLRPGMGDPRTQAHLVPPEYERFRNYFGSAGLKRVRHARRVKGSQRFRTVFMILMVLVLGFILLKMVT